MQIAIKNVVLREFHGRKTVWILALVVSAGILIVRFLLLRPTCDLMFYPAEVAREYVIAWLLLFAFIGVTNRAKLILALGVLVWLGTKPLIEYRIPANERRAVWRLNEMQSKLRLANAPARELPDNIGSDLGEARGGYRFEYLPAPQGSASKRYVIGARPQCYCMTGQRSFSLDDSGAIHYTAEDRPATLNDPVVRQD